MRFFDIDVTIQSDTPELIEFLRQVYSRFEMREGSLSKLLELEFALYTRSANPWGKPVLVLDGEAWPLDASGVLERFAYDGLINKILTKVRSHYLIHASALSLSGQGIIFVGDSGYGKTTLSLALVQRGLKFLSDELAAINRLDRRLYAFPRRLRVRPDTLNLLGAGKSHFDTPLEFGKHLIDIEELVPGSLVESASIQHVVILEDAHPNREDEASREIEAFGVYLNRIEEELIDEVSQLQGVLEVSPTQDLGYPLIRVTALQKARTISGIEEICKNQGILILEISKRSLKQPNFQGSARIEPIPKSQAVMGLLRQFLPGHQSALLIEDYGGRPTRLFIELASLLKDADCYRLQVGPLNQMVDLVRGTVNR